MPGIRLALSVYFIFCCIHTAFAQQDTTHQKKRSNSYFSIGVGQLTTDYLLDGYHDKSPDYKNAGPPITVCVSYKSQLTRKEYIGLTATVEELFGDWMYYDNTNSWRPESGVKGSFVRTCYTIAGEYTEDYFSRGIIKLFYTVGFGGTYEIETTEYDPGYYITYNYKSTHLGYGYWPPLGAMKSENKRTHVNAYFSPFGLSIGKKFSFSISGGFGYKGIVNTSLTYKLARKETQKPSTSQ